MATIRVDKKFWSDPRLKVMSEKIHRVACYGAVLNLWQIGQEHWKRGELIPHKVFDELPYSAHLLRAGFVEKRDDGVYCLGAKDRWKYISADQQRQAGLKSAQSRAKKYGSSQPGLVNAALQTTLDVVLEPGPAERTVRTGRSESAERFVRETDPAPRTERSNGSFDNAAPQSSVSNLERASIETPNCSSINNIYKTPNPVSDLELGSQSAFSHQTLHNSQSSRVDRENLTPGETPTLFPTLVGPEPKKSRKKPERKTTDQSAGLFVARYCEVYKARWKVNPVVIGIHAGAAKRIVQAIGVNKAIELVEVYLTMNERWFIQKKHDLVTFEQNLNSVVIKAGTGLEVTSTEATAIDKKQANANAFAEIAAELRSRGET